MVQVVLPKTGSTTLKNLLGPRWRLLERSNASLTGPPPLLAGDCETPARKKRGFRRGATNLCVTDRTAPCSSRAGTRDCRFAAIANHLSYSEAVRGFLGERGIFDLMPPATRRLVIFTVLRPPLARVASEYHNWRRGWCCGWFFSSDLARVGGGNLTLEEFAAHPDCPANNRQAWALADLPLLRKPAQAGGGAAAAASAVGAAEALRSDGPAAFGAYYSPSQFPHYFRLRYGGRPDYAAALNRDTGLLASAQDTVATKAAAVGLTGDMEATLALVLFAATPPPGSPASPASSLGSASPVERGHGSFFSWRPGGLVAGFEAGSGAAGQAAAGARGCWQLEFALTGAPSEAIALPVREMRFDRAANYSTAPADVAAAVLARNALDVRLYATAVATHNRQLRDYRICRTSSPPV